MQVCSIGDDVWLYWLAFALLFYTAVYVGVLYLTDIFFVLLCESEGVTWFALNEMKTTRKVRSLAAHRIGMGLLRAP